MITRNTYKERRNKQFSLFYLEHITAHRLRCPGLRARLLPSHYKESRLGIFTSHVAMSWDLYETFIYYSKILDQDVSFVIILCELVRITE